MDNIRFIKKETVDDIVAVVKDISGRGYITFSQVPSLIDKNRNSGFNMLMQTYTEDGKVVIKPEHLKGVTYIGGYFFKGSESLYSVHLPDTVGTIGNNSFENCKLLETLNTGNGLTVINPYAFTNCINLKNLTLGEKISRIGHRAFENCQSLQTITIPNSVTSLDDSIFDDCIGLTEAIFGNEHKQVPGSMFRGCSSLSSFEGQGIELINSYAFSQCNSLSRINIGDSVNKLGDGCFTGCSSLEEAKFGNVSEIGTQVFSDCTSLKEVQLGGISEIKYRAFHNCSSLNSVNIASGAYIIGERAFENCNLKRGLVNNILASATEIGEYSFYYALEKQPEDENMWIYITSKTSFIGNNAFYGNSSLKSVVFSGIGSKSLTIDEGAFTSCNLLEHILFDYFDYVPTLTCSALNIFPSSSLVYVPYSMYEEWINAPNWSDIADRIRKDTSTMPTEEGGSDV